MGLIIPRGWRILSEALDRDAEQVRVHDYHRAKVFTDAAQALREGDDKKARKIYELRGDTTAIGMLNRGTPTLVEEMKDGEKASATEESQKA